jgi:hypothetical protein
MQLIQVVSEIVAHPLDNSGPTRLLGPLVPSKNSKPVRFPKPMLFAGGIIAQFHPKRNFPHILCLPPHLQAGSFGFSRRSAPRGMAVGLEKPVWVQPTTKYNFLHQTRALPVPKRCGPWPQPRHNRVPVIAVAVCRGGFETRPYKLYQYVMRIDCCISK